MWDPAYLTIGMVLHSLVYEWRIWCEAIVGHIHELSNKFSRRVGRRFVRTLRILNGEGPLDGSMNGWSIGAGIYPNESKTR